jgi:hypothetical protein
MVAIVSPLWQSLTAIAGNGLEPEERNTSSERITYHLELGASIATQQGCLVAALEGELILDGLLNIGREQIVANDLSISKENELTPKLFGTQETFIDYYYTLTISNPNLQ